MNSKEGENYFVVEFKHDRMDAYYMPLDSMTTYKVGDLVIVEADRGQDLGKIVKDRVNMMQLQQIQAEHRMKMADTPRQFEPKRILRHAHPAEVSQLVTKAQDEAKALQMCHVKLRHHNLPMEIVDAEYQWDRRKLTFFYRAEERIDFRELVRELFKVYKTRIWMRALLA
ncbi:PSP1-domain-containing protein [Neoconidiobolus thromboides FSU 785]|nr:PSP1-domain-containing protein [Neoconidiobolus thromboides FSU 785]